MMNEAEYRVFQPVQPVHAIHSAPLQPPRPSAAGNAKPLREAMPEVAGFIDALRDAFGRDSVDPSLTRGLEGEPTFYAVEGGRSIGTRPDPDGDAIWRVVRIADRYYCNGCDGSCAGTGTRCRSGGVDIG